MYHCWCCHLKERRDHKFCYGDVPWGPGPGGWCEPGMKGRARLGQVVVPLQVQLQLILFVSTAWRFISRDCSCALLWLYLESWILSGDLMYLNVGSQSLVWMTSIEMLEVCGIGIGGFMHRSALCAWVSSTSRQREYSTEECSLGWPSTTDACNPGSRVFHRSEGSTAAY